MAHATDEWVRRMSPRQRLCWAFGFVAFFAALALLAAGYVYWWPLHRSPPQRAAVEWAEVLPELRDGDIIFHTSHSAQSQAIQVATGSPYSHCGLIFLRGEDWQVIEAVQPVKWTSLEAWVQRGKAGHFVVKRAAPEAPLSSAALQQVRQVAEAFLGRDYDAAFGWDDQRIYCSELVWKAYERATGLQLGELSELRSFRLEAPAVQTKLKERYGDRIPLDEPVIAPSAIFESPLLLTVVER